MRVLSLDIFFGAMPARGGILCVGCLLTQTRGYVVQKLTGRARLQVMVTQEQGIFTSLALTLANTGDSESVRQRANTVDSRHEFSAVCSAYGSVTEKHSQAPFKRSHHTSCTCTCSPSGRSHWMQTPGFDFLLLGTARRNADTAAPSQTGNVPDRDLLHLRV